MSQEKSLADQQEHRHRLAPRVKDKTRYQQQNVRRAHEARPLFRCERHDRRVQQKNDRKEYENKYLTAEYQLVLLLPALEIF